MKLKISHNGAFIELDFSDYSIDEINVESRIKDTADKSKSKLKSKSKSKKIKMGFI
jgi:hypothetical protein